MKNWQTNVEVNINETLFSLTSKSNLHKNIYNEARCNEVAVVYIGEDGQPPTDRDICICSKTTVPKRIAYISKHVDPMTYTIMSPSVGFSFGGFGGYA